MAYVRTSRSRGGEYRQIVESFREDGKVRQRVLVHLPCSSETPEHAAELCEKYAERERSLEERYAREAEALRSQRERCIDYRKQRGWSAGGFAQPGRAERAALRDAEHYGRQAQKNEVKAKAIREILAAGKIQPDPPEVREARHQRQRARAAELEKMEANLNRLLGP